MKKILLFMFLPAAMWAQDAKAEFQGFKAKVDYYLSNGDNTKPAPCDEYRLQFIVKGEQFSEEVTKSKDQPWLCEGIEAYEGRPGYDLKAVSDRYYIIRADKGDGAQEFYYYMRTAKRPK
jgi:hypothetical protein